MRGIHYYVSLFVLLFLVSCGSSTKNEATSPNGNLAIQFNLDEVGKPHYLVKYKGRELVALSKLGLSEKGGTNLSSGFVEQSQVYNSYNEEWNSIWGENKQHKNHYNELVVSLKNSKNVNLTLFFRAYDEGVAFRYKYDVSKADSLYIIDENTEFNFVDPATTWSIPGNFETYELLYRKLPLDSLVDANTPITFKFDNFCYASLHEAALVNYPEMTVKTVEPRKLKANLAPLPNGIKAELGNSFTTPWRYIQVTDKAADLIASSLILNLNEPSVIKDGEEWIKPMKYVGVWWGMHLGIEAWYDDALHRHGATTANAIKHIDFAAQNNIEGVLFEGWNKGWATWGVGQNFDYVTPASDFDMDQVVAYAKEKGVKVIGHHETGGNIPHYEQELDTALNYLIERGIHDLKTGYAGGFPNGYLHHSQYGVRHYRKVVEEAAKKKITINAHEPIKDTGLRRTYPNSMSREGARGMEWNAWSAGNPPVHHVDLVFTRLLAGPMDYTPGTFDILFKNSRDLPQRRKWNDQDQGVSRVNTTLAKQVALWVVLYSPVQMASDLPSNYEGHPAFQFFRDFDADIDATFPLDGEPGEFVVIARQAKDRFFLGAITNEEARDVTANLSFLKDNITYEATIYADGDEADWVSNPQDYKITKQVVKKGDSINLHLANGGGAAISFIPVERN